MFSSQSPRIHLLFLLRPFANDGQDGRTAKRDARIRHDVHLLAAKPLAFTRLASLVETSMLNTLHSRGEAGRTAMTSSCGSQSFAASAACSGPKSTATAL